MPLPIKSFDTLVSDQAAAMQAVSSQKIDFQVGSIIRALIEANANMGFYLEFLAMLVLAEARAQTSSGEDLDTWCAQFDFFRLPANKAVGSVVFSRFTASMAAYVPINTLLKTTDGAQSFIVIEDTGNIHYNAFTKTYTLPIGLASLAIACEAVVGGLAGNVLPDSITLLSSPISSIDAVNNVEAFVSGTDIESDDAFRARFILYINSLSKATQLAIENAIESVSGVTRYSLRENVDYDGNPDIGHFTAVIDNGTGSPPVNLLNRVRSAVEAVRGFTITYQVNGPTPILVTVDAVIHIDTNTDPVALTPVVEAAITTYINDLSIGVELPFTKMYEIIYDSSAFVLNVSGLLVNGGTADLASIANQAFISSTINLTFVTSL